MPDGLLNVLKPPGITSHDLVDQVRRLTDMRRVGHAGTLDPAAAGVVLVMLGRMTRLAEYLTGTTKVYRAEITLGISTDTLDGEGRITGRASAAQVTAEQAARELTALTGDLMVAPPMHSAVWHHGRRLYELARSGERVKVEPRPMRVLRFELLHFEPGETARALTEVECAKGTYVRSLAARLGERLGCGAYLSFLVRTRVGAHGLADAHTVPELAELRRTGRLREALIPPERALPEFLSLRASAEEALALSSGNPVPAPQGFEPGRLVAALTGDGRLLGICEVTAGEVGAVLQPRRVLIPAGEL